MSNFPFVVVFFEQYDQSILQMELLQIHVRLVNNNKVSISLSFPILNLKAPRSGTGPLLRIPDLEIHIMGQQ